MSEGEAETPRACLDRARALSKAGRLDEAVAAWRKAVELDPNFVRAHAALGAALRHLGRHDEALVACRNAVRLAPHDPRVRLDLANVLHNLRRYAEAAAELEHVIKLDPANPRPLNNYANLLAETRRLAQAVAYFRAALALDPGAAEIHGNLGNALKKLGRAEEAITCCRKALELKPEAWEIHSNLLLTLNSRPAADNGLFREHVEWAQQHAARFYPPREPPFPNDRNLHRRLRIGYVSPDFRRHSVARFFEPLLLHHDRTQVEVFCYSNVARPDDVTESMRARADGWRDIVGLPDEQVVNTARQDRIDILIDLAGHTANHRLLVFARRAAPVQMTYIGYPNTTGLGTIDYRVTDAWCDPPGMTEAQHTEQLVRLPGGFLCFAPPAPSPPPRPPPRETGAAVFGSFNNLAKVTEEVVALWSRVLLTLPTSRLLLKADGLADQQAREELRRRFESNGVSGKRIEMLGRDPSFQNHLATYHRIDVALDSFPYHGTTTTCEALWMGVPVVTVAGRAHVSRVGVSLLARVGLTDLATASADQYVATAVNLASDVARRRHLSASLRGAVRARLADIPQRIHELEEAYREKWQIWCHCTGRPPRLRF